MTPSRRGLFGWLAAAFVAPEVLTRTAEAGSTICYDVTYNPVADALVVGKPLLMSTAGYCVPLRYIVDRGVLEDSLYESVLGDRHGDVILPKPRRGKVR